jgi:hypothetical protein
MVVKRERSCAYVVSSVWGEPPSRFGTTLRARFVAAVCRFGDSGPGPAAKAFRVL